MSAKKAKKKDDVDKEGFQIFKPSEDSTEDITEETTENEVAESKIGIRMASDDDRDTVPEVQDVEKNERQRLDELTINLKMGLPTFLELKNGTAGACKKLIDWEERCGTLVEEWRQLRSKYGLSTNLDSIRDAGVHVDSGQLIRRGQTA